MDCCSERPKENRMSRFSHDEWLRGEIDDLEPINPDVFRQATPEELAMDVAERGPELLDRILEVANTWCRASFGQAWACAGEVGEIPLAEPGNLFGYRAVVEMPDYPHRELVDVLVAFDTTIVGVQHIL